MAEKKLTVQITGDARNVRQVLGDLGDDVDRVDGRVGKAGRNWSGALSGLAAGGAVAAAGVAAAAVGIGYMVNEAEQARKVGAETERVLRTTGAAAWTSEEAIAALAETTSRKTGIDDEAIQSTANWLLTFRNVKDVAGEGNDVFTQSVQLSQDMATVMGGDAQASATLLGKALNDPIRGMTAMTRAGVTFTQSQRDQVRALVETGDTLGAQKVILAEVAAQFEGAAAAAASPWDFAKVEIGNVAEALGGQLLPMVSEVISATTPLISQWGDNFAPIMAVVGDLIADMVGPLGDWLSAAEDMLPVFTELFAGVLAGAMPVLDAVTGLISDLAAELGPELEPIAQDLGDSVAQLGQSFAELISEAEPLIPLVADMVTILAEAVGVFADVASAAGRFGHEVLALNPALGIVDMAFGDGIESGSGFADTVNAAAGAAREAAPVTVGQALAMDNVASAAATADAAMQDWNETLQEIFGGGLDVFGATTKWEEQIDSLTAVLMTNGATIDANTEAGRKNRDALQGAAESALSLAQAYANTGDIEAANAALASSRERLIESGVAAGQSREQMELYLDALGLTPENITTAIGLETPNLPQVEGDIDHAARGRDADIFARHYGADAAERILNHTSRGRTANVNARANGIAWVEGQLANLTRDRWVEIHTSIGPAPPGFNNAERTGRAPTGRSTVGLLDRPITVPVSIDGKKVAEAVYKPLSYESARRGGGYR